MKLRSLVLLVVLLCCAAGPVLAGDVLDKEALGGIKLGTSQTQILTRFGKPQSKSAEILEAATGLYVETWKWPLLTIHMSSTKKGGPKAVASILTSRPALSTARGIHVGSSAADVRKAYGKSIDASASNGEQIVVGSIYGGVIFTMTKGGKVGAIFLGAGAE